MLHLAQIVVWRKEQRENAGQPWRSYQLAGRTMVADMPLAELALFEQDVLGSKDQVHIASPVKTDADREGAVLTYRGPGWVGNRWRQVACRAGPGAYWLAVEGAGHFTIANAGEGCTQIEVQAERWTGVVAQTVLGPALVLALALHGTWCLHASAAAFGPSAVAFVAASGQGKSTLAAFLGNGGDSAWRRLADDLLPVTLLPHSPDVTALPHFPQLKLPADAQPAVGMPEQMPLAAVYVLEQTLAGQDSVEITPLGWQDATVSVVRHTMGTALFDRDLLAQHLSFAAEAAARIPVRRLAFAHRYELLPAVRDALAADLKAVHLQRTTPPSPL